MKGLIPQERIESRIFLIRGRKVMIDRDLAILYGVDTKYVNRQVKRNFHRFPEEFMFRLTKEEKDELVPICHRFQSLKHSSSLPYAFTEHGVIMLASVLNSERATKISIAIVKTFVRLREVILTHKDLFYKLSEIEKRVDKHDKLIIKIFEIIKQLTETLPEPPPKPKGPIGFHSTR